MFKQNELLKIAMLAFPGSFVNHNNELILVPKTNLYFGLESIKDEIEFKCKMLECCSRDASKSMPYDSDWKNKKYWDYVREGINKTLGTNFSHEEMYRIYSVLGQRVNRPLTIQFIESKYDMCLLSGGADE